MRTAAFVLGTFLVSVTAIADISGVAPTTFYTGSVEEFITVSGSGLSGTDFTTVVFSGPAGTFNIPPSLESDTSLTVYVPDAVLGTAGHYSITVEAHDLDTTVRTSGPAFFDVIARPLSGPPLLNLPEVLYAEATSAAGANVTFSANAIDQGGTGLTISCDHASGSLFALGTTAVGCTATDSFGSSIGFFLVVVGDTKAPVLTLPADIISADPVVTFTVTATDNIDGAITPVCSPASGSTFDVGETTVVCTATDAHANTAKGEFHVTIVQGPPTLVLPEDMTVEATGPTGAVATFVVTSVPDSVITCTPPSGSTFPLGTTLVQCSGTNVGGTATGSFKVTVVDTTPPVIDVVNATPNVLTPPDHKMIPVTITVVAHDLVDTAPVSHILSVSSNQPTNGPGDGNTSPDWIITGPLTLELRAERSGVLGDRIYTITIETMDFSGNKTTATVIVRVPLEARRRAV